MKTSTAMARQKGMAALGYHRRYLSWLLLLGFLLLQTAAMADQELSMAPVTPSTPDDAPVVPKVDDDTTAPFTSAPQSPAPITTAPTTPVTLAPVTTIPADVPITAAPVTAAPASPAPVTSAPVTPVPTSLAPVTAAPSALPSVMESDVPSIAPVTATPTFFPSAAPQTRSPVNFIPPTDPPVTTAPLSLAPVTMAPSSLAPVTMAPITMAPVTMAPVAPPGLAVNATTISVVMSTVDGRMDDAQQEVFRVTVESFLAATLSQVEPQPVFNVQVQVTDQSILDVEFKQTRRSLQEASLMVTMLVEGTVTENPDDVNLAWLSLLMFDINGKTFVDDLTKTGDDYFKDVKEVVPVNPPEDSTSPSSMPSVSATPSTVLPSASPSPSSVPTTTFMPTKNNVVTATDRFAVTLYSVSQRMSPETAETFRTTAELFLGTNFELLEQPLSNVKLQVVGQQLQSTTRRSLQQLLPLEVELTIEGDFVPQEGQDDDINLSRTSRNFFDAQADVFVDLLQESDRVEDAVFFANVNDVESVDEPDDVVVGSPTSAPVSSGGGGGLAIGAIIAIALCGTLAVSLTAAAVYQHRRRSRGAAATPTPVAKPPSQRPSSGNVNSFDADSVLHSDMQSQMGADTLAGADTMSYAYSLDHGIDPSVASGPQGSYYASSSGAVPNEIPMVGSLGTEDYDYDGMPAAATQANKITRECFAPPGRLGVVIDTTVEGPVVHKVNPGSPLEGIVWPGDIIIAIDDTDTRSLAANDITALMVKNQDQRRKLTIVSDA